VTARIYTPSGAFGGSKTQNIAVPAGSKKSVDFELAVEKTSVMGSRSRQFVLDQR